jgi:hypothetical protein
MTRLSCDLVVVPISKIDGARNVCQGLQFSAPPDELTQSFLNDSATVFVTSELRSRSQEVGIDGDLPAHLKFPYLGRSYVLSPLTRGLMLAFAR